MNVVSGNVFDAFLQPNSLVVHGCNAQGVMGSGVAKYVKDNFPSAYYEYLRHHEEHGLKLGEVIPALVLPGRWILNAITQEFYGRDPGRVYVDYCSACKVKRSHCSYPSSAPYPVANRKVYEGYPKSCKKKIS